MKQGTHAMLYFRITKPLHPQYHYGSEIFYSTHASFVVHKGAQFKVLIAKYAQVRASIHLDFWNVISTYLENNFEMDFISVFNRPCVAMAGLDLT